MGDFFVFLHFETLFVVSPVSRHTFPLSFLDPKVSRNGRKLIFSSPISRHFCRFSPKCREMGEKQNKQKCHGHTVHHYKYINIYCHPCTVHTNEQSLEVFDINTIIFIIDSTSLISIIGIEYHCLFCHHRRFPFSPSPSLLSNPQGFAKDRKELILQYLSGLASPK